MNRRQFITALSITAFAALNSVKSIASSIEKFILSDKEWRMKLNDKQYNVLRDEGTEPSWSSPLNNEKRKGVYKCVGCDLELFTSEMKFDSGSGWPSFYTSIKGALETKKDWKLFVPRTEYHCARCGGHQGHVFEDGPKPTGQRWCNNGIALKFTPENSKKNV